MSNIPFELLLTNTGSFSQCYCQPQYAVDRLVSQPTEFHRHIAYMGDRAKNGVLRYTGLPNEDIASIQQKIFPQDANVSSEVLWSMYTQNRCNLSHWTLHEAIKHIRRSGRSLVFHLNGMKGLVVSRSQVYGMSIAPSHVPVCCVFKDGYRETLLKSGTTQVSMSDGSLGCMDPVLEKGQFFGHTFLELEVLDLSTHSTMSYTLDITYQFQVEDDIPYIDLGDGQRLAGRLLPGTARTYATYLEKRGCKVLDVVHVEDRRLSNIVLRNFDQKPEAVHNFIDGFCATFEVRCYGHTIWEVKNDPYRRVWQLNKDEYRRVHQQPMKIPCKKPLAVCTYCRAGHPSSSSTAFGKGGGCCKGCDLTTVQYAQYCSQACLRKDWSRHKQTCTMKHKKKP